MTEEPHELLKKVLPVGNLENILGDKYEYYEEIDRRLKTLERIKILYPNIFKFLEG